MVKATANRDFVFWSFNCLSKNGRKLRKDRPVKIGQEFEVVRFFAASGGVFAAGAKCVAVRGHNGSLMGEFYEYFDYECEQETCPPQVKPLSCVFRWSCPIARAELAKELDGWIPANALEALTAP